MRDEVEEMANSTKNVYLKLSSKSSNETQEADKEPKHPRVQEIDKQLELVYKQLYSAQDALKEL
jgi:hypothetical protein